MIRYQPITLQYDRETSSTLGGGVSTLDGTDNLNCAIELSSTNRIFLKPLSAQISVLIPNIFSYGAFNNRLLRVKTSVADPWTTITLTPGVYLSAAYIEAAITDVLAASYTDPADPAIRLESNGITNQIFLIIDSTKLSAGTQACIDFTLGNISTTIGFIAVKTFIADGIYNSSAIPEFDTQGTICNVNCSISSSKIINGVATKCFMSIPLVLMTSAMTEYVFPGITNCELTPFILQGQNRISSYDIYFTRTDGEKMVFLNGSRCSIAFEIMVEV